ncbi:histidine kinase [Malaciobacter halophilus]|uniref:histidine kinase n=1 Tax=Malaciobacter halophilus TaxID=197482 RepID=A0A2N1J1U1_9BACT|nr:ABC transporter substrate binding protein [Malaciobacter halophilus]AXH10833.1 two-component system sensor histidine kinase [Malaciobacter halophilus]PKI80516.1 histidine kinase [Malaciobacter halophilus]
MRVLVFILLFISSIYAQPQKDILILHSYNSGLKWSDGITQGIKKVFKDELDYELTFEYMDSKKIDTKEYFSLLEKLYKQKFSNRDYELIIAIDNYAFDFVLKKHKEIFNSVPIVFCGVENFKESQIPDSIKEFVTGVVEFKHIKRNIELIKDVIPDLSTLYIISDSSFSSSAIKKQILKASEKFKNDFKIIFNDNVDFEYLKRDLRNLPKNSAALFTSLYIDRYHNYIPYNKIRKLFKNSKVPIFAVNKIHLKEGVVGGIMVSPQEQGEVAAKKALQILKNRKLAGNLEVETPSSKYFFDDEMLKKYGIDSSNIPMLSNVINKPQSFFEKNREIIDSSFVMIPFLILLILALVVNIIKRISLEIKLVEQSKLDKVLLNNVKSGIYWQSNQGVLLGCNEAFCDFLGTKKDKLIGKYMSKVLPEIYEKIRDFDDFLCNEIEVKLKLANKDGIYFIKRKVYLDKNNKEAGIVTVISDITKMRNLELQRKKEEQFLIQRSKLSEIGEMITSIAHQWKTPLIEVSTIAQEMMMHKRRNKELSLEDTKDFVDEIMTQIQYMTTTIDDFRAFIKPSNTKKEFAVQDAIKELLKVIEHNIKYNYIEVEVNYEKDNDLNVYGYPNEFKQSILNIINNSRDSILKKREIKDFQGKITIDIYSENNKIYILLKDNGIGIKKENLEIIFDAFYTTKKSGDGFGLYMAKLIIEDKMDGNIEALECKKGAQLLVSLNSLKGKDESIVARRQQEVI